jgi:hypothetical protein
MCCSRCSGGISEPFFIIVQYTTLTFGSKTNLGRNRTYSHVNGSNFGTRHCWLVVVVIGACVITSSGSERIVVRSCLAMTCAASLIIIHGNSSVPGGWKLCVSPAESVSALISQGRFVPAAPTENGGSCVLQPTRASLTVIEDGLCHHHSIFLPLLGRHLGCGIESICCVATSISVLLSRTLIS